MATRHSHLVTVTNLTNIRKMKEFYHLPCRIRLKRRKQIIPLQDKGVGTVESTCEPPQSTIPGQTIRGNSYIGGTIRSYRPTFDLLQ